ncbi:Xaa-Pro peptidase family protein [Frigidibacter sp.]|uniref:M24 family metallopeptidase n=1 Tax=Frigidibacter sp. TaxID=2586418 RepID=UPI002733362F|nr:M24 family metallopeptidase [Frigidibacter sp.]MDP3342207.1 M24 family metallopeptidase [Frigidibacter sp.]
MKTVSPISDAEMARRWQLARTVMSELGLDALVMQAREDWMGGYVRWFTDVPAMNGYPRSVIFWADRPMTVVEMGAFGTDRSLTHDAVHRGVDRILGTPSFVSIHYTVEYDSALVVQALSEGGARRVGLLAPGALPHSLVAGIAAWGFEAVDATDALDLVKAPKSPEEQELIRLTAALQDAVFAEVCDAMRPGVTDRQIMAVAEAAGRRLGSDQGIHLGLSARLGEASRFHGRHLQQREMAQGDHLSILIEVNGPGGIYLEIARTMVLGAADDHLLQAFAHVKAAQDHVLGLLLPGADPAAVALAHDGFMQARDLPAETRLFAHGQGSEMVERPLIRQDETLPLAEGMLMAVHPGYDDGRVFAVICDNYLIGPNGPGECLHRTEKKIFEL